MIERTFKALWRALESPLVRGCVGESTFDFYARLVDPRLTARTVIARVQSIVQETPSVKSFLLEPNGHFRGFRAGQHVSLTVEIDGVRHTRFYSPSNAPAERGIIVLTVKRHPEGRVSRWLHERLEVGHFVELGRASGELTPLPEPRKLLLIAGGSGITPLASVLRDACRRGPTCDIVVLDYVRTRSEVIFARELEALCREHPGLRVQLVVTGEALVHGALSGRFSATHLDLVAPDVRERQTLVCGPPTLVDGVWTLWAARAISSPLKMETFAPLDAQSRGPNPARVFRVDAARSARSFAADGATPLLRQAEAAGLSPASGCRQGICFSCTCHKRTGVVRNISTGVISSDPDEDIRLCISVPLSDVTLDL